MTPLVSVLMPSYNHGRYIETAVRSVLDQDWPRVELVALDDGSTDGTWDVLEGLRPECERRLERVVMERQENQGTCVTMNRLRREARGDYVAILASDDAYLPRAFAHLLAPMEKDSGIGVTVGRNELMDGEGRRCYWDGRQNVVYDPAAAEFAYFNDFLRKTTGVDDRGPDFGSYRRLLWANHIVNGLMIRRSVLDRVPPLTTDAPLEDWWLNLQLAKLTRCAAVPEAVFRYRWHAANTARQRERMMRNHLRTLDWEEAYVAGLPDRRWQAEFNDVYREVRRKFALGGILSLDTILTLHDRRKVLTVLGHEFTLSCRRGDFGIMPKLGD